MKKLKIANGRKIIPANGTHYVPALTVMLKLIKKMVCQCNVQ